MAELCNIYDRSLVKEQVEFDLNTEADAFARVAPPEDGLWLVSLQPIPDGQYLESLDRNQNPYYAINLVSKFTTPERKDLDGRELTDFYVSTMVMASSGTCRVAGVLRALRAQVKGRTTSLALMLQLADLLKSQPSCRIETQWEARVATGGVTEKGKAEYKTILRGMSRFPRLAKPGPNGQKFNHRIYWDANSKRIVPSVAEGEEVVAMPRIIRYAAVGG